MKKENPIGVFDSGIGGLTVATEIKKQLPNEQIVYFGDLAHLPYGDKSTAAIQAYAIKICDFLLSHHCKVILIACNSASAAAYELVKAYVGTKAKVLNVIDPTITYISMHHALSHVGLIGTKQTVSSGVYQKKIDQLLDKKKIHSLATPLLAPMIEEGWHKDKISSEIIGQYLSDAVLEGIEVLILGCTHYPVIRKHIEAYYKGAVNVIDSAHVVVAHLNSYLEEQNLKCSVKPGEDRFFVSDFTTSFEAATELFFHKKVVLEKHVLWE